MSVCACTRGWAGSISLCGVGQMCACGRVEKSAIFFFIFSREIDLVFSSNNEIIKNNQRTSKQHCSVSASQLDSSVRKPPVGLHSPHGLPPGSPAELHYGSETKPELFSEQRCGLLSTTTLWWDAHNYTNGASSLLRSASGMFINV